MSLDNSKKELPQDVFDSLSENANRKMIKDVINEYGYDSVTSDGKTIVHAVALMNDEKLLRLSIDDNNNLINQADNNGNTPIHDLINKHANDKHTEYTVKEMMYRGADPSLRNDEGYDALMIAAESASVHALPNYRQMVEKMANAGANMDYSDVTQNAIDPMEAVMEARDTAKFLALKEGRINDLKTYSLNEMANEMISCGAKFEGRPEFENISTSELIMDGLTEPVKSRLASEQPTKDELIDYVSSSRTQEATQGLWGRRTTGAVFDYYVDNVLPRDQISVTDDSIAKVREQLTYFGENKNTYVNEGVIAMSALETHGNYALMHAKTVMSSVGGEDKDVKEVLSSDVLNSEDMSTLGDSFKEHLSGGAKAILVSSIAVVGAYGLSNAGFSGADFMQYTQAIGLDVAGIKAAVGSVDISGLSQMIPEQFGTAVDFVSNNGAGALIGAAASATAFYFDKFKSMAVDNMTQVVDFVKDFSFRMATKIGDNPVFEKINGLMQGANKIVDAFNTDGISGVFEKFQEMKDAKQERKEHFEINREQALAEVSPDLSEAAKAAAAFKGGRQEKIASEIAERFKNKGDSLDNTRSGLALG